MTRKAKIITTVCAVSIIMVVAVLFNTKLADNDAVLAPQEVQDTMAMPAVDEVTVDASKDPDSEKVTTAFPDMGKSIKDFLVAPYEVALEDRGLLDGDDLEDIALILQDKDDSTALRPTLVLLRQIDGSYKLYATSWNAIGPAYINGDYQHYDDENLTIDSLRNLNIHTFGSGPVGNRDLNYRFIAKQLVLVSMETYNMGAGGHTEAFYDFVKGRLKVTEINTMKEDMPSTTTVEKLKKRSPHLFETTDPEAI